MDDHQPGTQSFIPREAPVCASVPTKPPMRLSISSTTGSRFELSAHPGETVEVVRRRLSQKLRGSKERFVLLHKEACLSIGKLQDLGIVDGSKLMLVPTIEAGLLTQPSGTEQTIMQALESLTETQVSDFLSGRSPLTLALGVGDHVMFVHLQLAPQNVAGQQQRHLIARSAGMAVVEQGDCSVAGTPTSKKPAAGEPGAVIESFVSHAPGVFSGTFSGTLHPAGQDRTTSSRQGINTILQILNDLLSATRHHQGAPLSLSQLRCPPPSTPTSSTQSTPTSPSPPPSPLTPDPVTTATSGPLMDHVSQGQSRSYKPTDQCFSQSKENQALRCKLQRLQILMHQRRLHRWARRDTRTSRPYSPHHHQPWSSGRRKANTRRHSNSNMSSRIALPWSCHGNPSCPPTL
ncbi:midnolin-like isoform X2 [Salvelinus namaycush]|uniref:Midnolin-like isoform X2 n=1 Tax=Salvelinus namaycush TaxID=8040 RepID=A0A8U0P7Y3_SALNM|nr:midnolin-like isoform X2 [Salvelinus namaycush]